MDQNLANELKRLRDERQKKFNEEDWEGALDIHNRILELSPSALRYANRGSILYRLNRLEEAIEDYRKALDMDPSLKRARADLERLENQVQKPTDSSSTAPNASKENKQAQIARLRDEREQKIKAGDWSGALGSHNKILEIEPSAMRYANQGSILYRMGKIKDAIESYRKALEMDPSLERARQDLEKLESQVEEEQLLDKNDKKDDKIPEKVEALRKKRQEMISNGEWEEALKTHDELLELEPTALRYANRGALLYRLGKYQQALDSYRKALEMDPDLEKAKEDMANLEAQLEAQKEEESLLPGESKAEEMSAEDRAAKIKQWRDERQTFLDNKEWEKALELHDKIIELEPTALRYVNRGSMCYRMGDLAKAIESYEIALEMKPDMGRAQNDLARLKEEWAKKKIQQSKEEEKQKEQQQKQVKEDDEEAIAEKMEELRKKRQEMIEEEKWEEALAIQDELIKMDPGSASRYASRGSLLYRIGRVDDAIRSYGKALELDKNLERAREDLERIKEDRMDHYRRLRQERMEEEDWDGTLEIHDLVLIMEPTALRYANRGSILYRLGRLSSAAQSYRKALELDPSLENAREDLEQIEEDLKESAGDSPALMAVPAEFEEDDEDIFDTDESLEEIEDSEEEDIEEDEDVVERKNTEQDIIFEEHKDEITQIITHPEKNWIISASKDNTIKIWSIDKKQCLKTLKGHEDWVRTIALTHNGEKIVSGSDDWSLKVWSSENGECEHTFTGHSMPVISLCISKNNRFALSGSRDHLTKIWDLRNGKYLNNLKGHSDWVSCITMAPEGNKAVSGSYDSTIKVWNVLGWRCMHTIEGHNGWIEKIMITPDGKHVISTSQDRTIKIWGIAGGDLINTLAHHTDRIMDSCLSEDGKLLASAGRDQYVHVWDIPSGEHKQALQGHIARFEKVVICNENKYIAAACTEGKMWLWSIETGKLLDTWQCGQVSVLLYLPKNNTLVSGDNTGKITLRKIVD